MRALPMLLVVLASAIHAETGQAGDEIRVENGLGFRTMMEPKFLREYWDSLADDEKLTGRVSDHLSRDQVASAVALQALAVAGFTDPVRTSLDDQLKQLLSGGRFHTGRLPEGFEDDRPPKSDVLLVRTKKGEYGLITFYSGFKVVELNKRVGVVLDEPEDKKDDGPRPADPVTGAMRAVLARVNKVHAGMDRKAIDDAVTELHREVARHDPKVFVPLAVPHLMRLAPHDTATRVLLRDALARGWLDEFAARADLVRAGDTPGPHVAAVLKALGGADRKARRSALRSVGDLGAAGADALPALRRIVDEAKADPADYRRAYTAREEVPDHVLAHRALTRIEAALEAGGKAR